MQIRVTIDTQALKVQTDREIKRLAYNVALALNETIKAVQIAQRVNLDRTFVVRQAGFLYRLIKITQFASAKMGIPFAEIVIDTTKQRVLLSTFESGGVKAPAIGKNVAVPLTGGEAKTRPSFEQGVNPTLLIKNLRFHKRVTSSGKVQWVGAHRTYIVPGVGIFQRGEGRKKPTKAQRRNGAVSSGSRLIYSFEKSPKLKPVLHFLDISVKVATEEWPKQFALAYRKP